MTYPIVPTDAGVTRQVLADHPDLMVVVFTFAAGAEGKLHSHVHVQSTYVAKGRFAFSVSGEEVEITAGQSLVVPSNAVHGCKCLEAGQLIDSFTPRRYDFL